jgi:anti-anti-sigma regulatory factor
MIFSRHSSIDDLRQFMESSDICDLNHFDLALDLLVIQREMLRVRRTANGDVVFILSGRIDEEHIVELEALLAAEGADRHIVLDLEDMTLTGQDGIVFLARCERKGIALVNCDPYIREWITRLGTHS